MHLANAEHSEVAATKFVVKNALHSLIALYKIDVDISNSLGVE